ncbi:MAG: 4Fe-4S binding protein [Oscillospiraceae bacterium]|nr:4Fe-4S binding protein [Oscillospiraceae bacterium]
MKKLTAKADIECMACLACENACSQAFYKKTDVTLACLHVRENKKGVARPVLCTQCGLCAKACPREAITQNPKGVYMLNKAKCEGCGLCVEACPFKVIARNGDDKPTKCIACGICAKNCPMDLLEVVENN